MKKPVSSISPKLIGLALCGLLAGGLVLSGCGGGEEPEETTNAPAKDAEPDEGS